MSAIPPAIPVKVAITLAGGATCAGMALVLTSQLIGRYGLAFSITHDKKRQIFLNLLCFMCAIISLVAFGFNATQLSLLVSDITTVLVSLLVLYSLMILNHNTFIRAANIVHKGRLDRQKLDKGCYAFYFLPIVIMIPIYFAFYDAAKTGKPLKRSVWNTDVFKPVIIVLILTTELVAVVTDVLLMRKIEGLVSDLGPIDKQTIPLSPASNMAEIEEAFQKRKSLYVNYLLTWTFVIADVVLKIIIISGNVLLFDDIVTILAIAMRSRTNLQFGLEMQYVVRRPMHSSAA